ncbi:alpha/beta hydrolase [Allosphingosinicella sp.]|uniref:alpha/beta hydrolase n=1 Tax=Allosphingosinicella sp. TaxID=2823234 RepID=UPI002F13D992
MPLLALVACVSCTSGPASSGAGGTAPEIIRIWPGRAPGTEGWTGPEQSADVELPNIGKVHIITNVTVPTVTVFRPPAGKANGTAVVVVPGGAFRALPWDLDGIETARWLTRRGITAFVLKYRVRPPGSGDPPDRSFDDFARRTAAARELAVDDAEQAMRLVRSRATGLGIAPDRIGMIGFSAGAMTTAILADSSDPAVRPNFAASLYGALLKTGPSPSAAPLFIVAAQDDPQAPPERSSEMFERWTSAKLPAELHIYERGGHGFAFRPKQVPADKWTEAFEAWLTSRGYIPAAKR